jgi:hypothetical protein
MPCGCSWIFRFWFIKTGGTEFDPHGLAVEGKGVYGVGKGF